MADPWFKFYPMDWRSDPCLRMCGPAARGLWIEMMCVMHEAQPYGHLLVNGNPPTDAQLAVLVGASADQLSALIGELESSGVLSRTRAGVIYSRRMTRDEKKRRTARKNGKNGGNPSLGNNKGNPASDNQQDKPQKPEARSQKPERETTLRVVHPREAEQPPKRRSRIPDAAVPGDGDYAAAEKRGLGPEEADHEFERFKNHHLAKGSLFLDWHRAWLTWLDSDYRKPRVRQGDPGVEARARAAADYARRNF